LIRQAISCDVCGTDMQQTNHWFVAYDQGGEIRVAAWNTRARLRSGAKHLCGQTCLHKLVDEFLVRTAAPRPGSHAKATEDKVGQATVRSALPAVDRPQNAAPRLAPRSVGRAFEPYIDEYESSARLLPAADAGPAAPSASVSATAWRSEAWKREREREANAKARTTAGVRRQSIA